MAKFGEAMRGLTVFIADIRNCKSKEAERKRINKELANIRSKFKGDKLQGYQKKKYVCKLMFIFLLGNDINFGYQEAVNLLSSIKYTEKQIGYLFVTVLMGEGHDLMPLVIQAIRHDLESRNPTFNTLAMQCIANTASREMAEQLGRDLVPNLLTSPDCNAAVKQTACLCLLKLLRVEPKLISMEQYSSRIIQFLNDRNLGLVTSACSLLEELSHTHPDVFIQCVPPAVSKLAGIVTKSHSDMQDYTYYFVAAPWLCVKLMKLLQCFPTPEDPIVKSRLAEAIDAILTKAQEPNKSKKVQHANSKNSVLFEAINLIVHIESDSGLLVRACNLLGGYLTNHKDPNLKYLSLEGLCSLATSEFSHEAVKKHQDTVLHALKTERDNSVRQKAIDLLYAMCDVTNSETIVSELLSYLGHADYSVREALVLKIAILSEKYAQDYTWYVDTILKLIRLAGDYVGEEVWYRIIQIVINKQEVQAYAAQTCFQALQAPACHENMIKVGSYIIGEFGNLVAGDPRSGPNVQFQLLHSKYPFCSLGTRALLLSTYIKLVNLYPEIKPQIQAVLEQDGQSRNFDLELQQRAIEYLKLSHIANPDLMATVLQEMPPFPEKDSLLLSKLYKTAPWMVKLHGGDEQDEDTTAAKQPSAIQPVAVPSAVPTPAVAAAAPAPIPSAVSAPLGGGGLDSLLLIDVAPSLPLDLTQSAPSTTGPPAPTEPAPTVPATGGTLAPGAEEGFQRFVFKNNGVLFENDVLQIGIKSMYQKTLGRIIVFYGNKSSSPLHGFSVTTNTADHESALEINLQPMPTTVEAGAQQQQVINVDCKNVFFEAPHLEIKFSVGGTSPQHIVLKLPLTLNKFCDPTTLTADDFFSRWKQLAIPAQEAQRVFPARTNMDKETDKSKLINYKLSLLENVDPNADNFVSAGIINTRSVLVGCLLRLEPNLQTKMYRLTVRTSHEGVSKMICDVLSPEF